MLIKMYYYKLNIAYDGTNYAGFQWQKDIPTIQNELNIALSKMVEGQVTTMSASRTDTGVHAASQIVKVSSINPIIKLSSEFFPSDIILISSEKVDEQFSPHLDSISKEYRYYFTNVKDPKNLNRRFVSNISNALDIELMKEASLGLIGTHDFKNFYSEGSNVKSTIRTIFECELKNVNFNNEFRGHPLFTIDNENYECYLFRIVGNGFLKQMNRHLISGLWKLGSGKILMSEFKKYLSGPKIVDDLWKVAPPNGLFLYKINY